MNFNFGVLISLILTIMVSSAAYALVPLTIENVNVARKDIKIWNLTTTGSVSDGTTTSTEDGKVNLTHSDGTNSQVDAKIKVVGKTLFQSGGICHNYGPKCYCGTTTFRLESGASKWKFGTPSGNQPVDCPQGVSPTGDKEIVRSKTAEEAKAARDQARAERAARSD